MPTEKPAGAKKARKRGPRPNNPYGIANEEWTRLNLETSRRYAGKCIAWSPGHDEVLAAGDDFDEVHAELGRLGIDASTAIHEYVETFGIKVFASRDR